MFVEQPRFQRFCAGVEIQVEKPGAEQHVHLVDVREC